MILKQKLINIARDVIVTFTAMATLTTSAYANIPKFQENVSNEIHIISPYDSFDVNTSLWNEINQGISTKTDEISDTLNLSDSIAGRTLTSLISLETNSITSGISHEIAHYVALRKTNPDVEMQFWDFLLYTNGAFMPKMEYPKIMSNLTKLLVSQHMVSGLNENENDASFLVTKSPNIVSLDDAFAFLTSKFFDEIYFLGEELYHPKGTDLSNYRNVVLKKFAGVELSKSQLLSQILISDFLSARTYESAHSILNYILNGDKETPTFTSTFSLPLISFYQTSKGSAYDISTIVNFKDGFKTRMSVLTDMLYLGESKLNTIRPEIAVYNLLIGNLTLNFSEAINIDLNKASISGNYSSLNMVYPSQPQNFAVSLNVSYSNNDILHNMIKCNDEGLSLQADFYLNI